MPVKGKKYRIGISGSYGGLNLGDEAILQCIIQQLRRSVSAEITVFAKDPEDTLVRHNIEKAVPVRKLNREEVTKEIESLDLFILGGGGILFDGEAKIYLREAMIANDLGIPVIVYAIGAGPLEDLQNQTLVRDILSRAAAITVRERSAKKVLEDAGIHEEIIITADPALLLAPEPLPPRYLQNEGLDLKRKLIGVSVREPGMAAPDLDVNFYHALLANAADYMIDRYDANVLFIPMERKVLDMQHSHAIISRMLRPQRAFVLRGKYSPGQIMFLMKNLEFAVGMRLHFLIFAALQEIPFIALPYASKVFGFLEDLGMEAPPLSLINSGRLIAHIDRSWDHRIQLKAKIRKSLPRLKERALETNRIAVEILKEPRRKKRPGY